MKDAAHRGQRPTKQKLKECSKRKEENIVGSWILLLDFGRDEKRELPGVIQQRYLHEHWETVLSMVASSQGRGLPCSSLLLSQPATVQRELHGRTMKYANKLKEKSFSLLNFML
ncbi:Line-1 Type Transposase Domain-Containing Protein 1 [Manis pentadactyla]|nr:Line-1 Type Transposase Domain-Containing Protein 1 [Manis pentadactyla]